MTCIGDIRTGSRDGDNAGIGWGAWRTEHIGFENSFLPVFYYRAQP